MRGTVAQRRRGRGTGRTARLCAALALGGAAGPLGAAAVLAWGPPLDGASAAALVVGACVWAVLAAALVALLLRPLEAVAAVFDGFAGPRAAGDDEFARIARGVQALEARLEQAVRRADPGRLEDPLTGLPNRLAIMRRARDEIARARRKALGLAVAVLEVELGGAAAPEADRALRVVAETAVQTLRAYDLVGRWGPTRFVAVLPEAEVENAVDAVRRVRDRLGEEPVFAALGAALCGGVAVLQPDDATLADVCARAELALGKARARGPGIVEAAPGPRTRPGRITSV